MVGPLIGPGPATPGKATMKLINVGCWIVGLALWTTGCRVVRNPDYCDEIEPECREGYVCDVKLRNCAKISEVLVYRDRQDAAAGARMGVGGATNA